MKPYVICHMVASIDGRTLISRWRPTDSTNRAQFAELHERLAVDAWLVGRATGAEYAKAGPYPALASDAYPREPWFARRDAVAYGVVLDAQGKIAWGRGDIDGDPILIDQPGAQKAAVGDAAAIDLEPLDAELPVEGFQRLGLTLASATEERGRVYRIATPASA